MRTVANTTSPLGPAQPQLRTILHDVMQGTASDLAAVRLAIRGAESVDVTVSRRGVVIPPTFLDTVARRLKRQRDGRVSEEGGPDPIRCYAAVRLALPPAVDGLLCVGFRRPAGVSPETLRSLESVARTLQLGLAQGEGERSAMGPAEAKRIAESLHDGPLQLLTHALHLIRRPPDPSGASLLALVAAVEESIAQLRSLTYRLRTGRDERRQAMHLRPALGRLAEGLSLECRLDWRIPDAALPLDARWEIYYIVREALINVSRHAGTRQVTVRGILRGKTAELWVRDRGKGFSLRAATAGASQGVSFGLLGIRERAARLGSRLQITSKRGGGTAVHLRVPTATGIRSGTPYPPRGGGGKGRDAV